MTLRISAELEKVGPKHSSEYRGQAGEVRSKESSYLILRTVLPRHQGAKLPACRSVREPMQTFRILYFDETVLEHTEEVRAKDVLEAVEKASGKPRHLRVEIWTASERVAEIGLQFG